MKNLSIKISLYINYFVFAILLNSVGIVILKSQNIYHVSELSAATLEPFKDFSIAIISFLVASFLPRFGYKKSMLVALLIVTCACIGMYFGNSFLAARLLFACIGTSFALIKISVYSVIGLITNNTKEHNSMMSGIEGFFMFGVSSAYFIFPFFNSDTDMNAWLNVYLFLALLSFMSFLFLLFSHFEEHKELVHPSLKEDFVAMFNLFPKKIVLIFLACAFLYVMIEQGIMTWLPTFNSRVLHLSENLSIMMASILAISLGTGRIFAGIITKRVTWFWVLSVCIVGAMIMVIFVLPEAIQLRLEKVTSIYQIPFLGFAFPLVGIFISPIYPLLNSVILSSLPKDVHSPMAGLIIVFSAVGGTLGSLLTASLFRNIGGDKAFTYTLIPLALLLACLIIFKRQTQNKIS